MHQSLCWRLGGQDQVLGLKALLSAVDDGRGEGVEASQRIIRPSSIKMMDLDQHPNQIVGRRGLMEMTSSSCLNIHHYKRFKI